MSDLDRSLSGLARLGLHLDPAEAEAARARWRVRASTRTYPLYRALGFQALLLVVVLHNLALQGQIAWSQVLPYVVLVELYVVLGWLALRRWYLRMPRLAGWDLGDLMFAADLVLWTGAIYLTGAHESWIFFLPLLRVADHRAARKVVAFAHLGPAFYLGLLLWVAVVEGRDPVWPAEFAKLFFLYGAGLYIAWTGRAAERLYAQREAALSVATGLLAALKHRTERLDSANRSRGRMLARITSELRAPLVEIAGFADHLLRSPRSAAEQRYLDRIHASAVRVRRALDEMIEPGVADALDAEVSLNAIIRQAAAAEAEESLDDDSPDIATAFRDRAPAHVVLPDRDPRIRTDPGRLGDILRHMIAAARHFGGGPPALALSLDPGTGLPESIRVGPAPPPGTGDERSDVFDPFADGLPRDPTEIGVRLELDIARSLADRLGYRLEAAGTGDRTSLVLKLR